MNMTNMGSRTLDTTIRFLKKSKNVLGSFRVVGLRGIPGLLREKLARTSALDISHEVADLDTRNLLFRYATCNDLISLLSKFPKYCREDRDSNRSTVWGLKSMGTLFCVDRIVQLKPERVLEIGPGWNRHFDEHFGSYLDYWMIDDASDIGWDKKSRQKFELSVKERQNTHFVRGFLGGFLPDLPDNGFDLVFSISVVEHVPFEHKANFYKDMFRIVKPGGYIAHSVDMFDNSLNQAEYEVISRAGFILPGKADLRVRVHPSQGNPTLFEDLWTVYHGYLGLNRQDKWDKLKRISGHNAALLVFARKPES